ncbi:MAG: Smr/MutS family protein [Arenicellales bacterium]
MDDDIDFKSAMGGVKPLNKDDLQSHSNAKPASKTSIKRAIEARAFQSAAFTQDDIKPAVAVSTDGFTHENDASHLLFLRQGLQKKILRELKKGTRYPVDDILDLHGYTLDQASVKIAKAIEQLPRTGLNCLLLIHGKGLRSTEGPVLKNFCAEHLKTFASVKAYCSAPDHDGGTGALYVLIKK